MQYLRRQNVLFLHKTYTPIVRFFNDLNEILATMPKVRNNAELREQRLKLRNKSQKYPPGITWHSVLGSGAVGTPASLYMFTDSTRYLFNCGEGAQRLAHEHKMKISKLEHVFITAPTWENIGGLPGMALTAQEVGVPNITLHGPPGTASIFPATERFIVLKNINIEMSTCTKFEDNTMTVSYVPLCHESLVLPTNECTTPREDDELEDNTDYYSHERKRKSTNFTQETKRQRTTSVVVPEERVTKTVMCYVCRLKPRQGTLNLEKCVEMGVPPGPLLGRLKAGEDIQLEDGTIVRSHEVCDPDDPGPVFLVVDCPSVDFLEVLVNNPVLSSYKEQPDASPENTPYLVVHFTPQHIMDNQRYQDWMTGFSFRTQHLVLNDGNHCTGFVASHRIQHKLHLIHPDIFPLLQDDGIPVIESVTSDNADVVERKSEEESSENSSLPQNSIQNEIDNGKDVFLFLRARTLSKINLRPWKGLLRDNEVTLDVRAFLDEAHAVENFTETLSSLKEKLSKITDESKEYPHLVFLGTGSSVPSKTRNTSGILLNISEKETVIIDCGEGTYGQMVRFYGRDKASEVMRKVRAIFVSHLHADHHIGLISLLKARRKAFEQTSEEKTPLFLLAPRQILYWLKFFSNYFEPIMDEFTIIFNANISITEEDSSRKISKTVSPHVQYYKNLLETLNMSRVKTVGVNHCANSFGIAFTHRDGWKITYSGDTMPCQQLVKLGRDSDLLIHEATMEDDLVEEARLKLHSTTSEAIKMGLDMGARYTLLTHFSQRYAKLPRFNPHFTSSVGIAFDNMKVRLTDLPTLPLLYPALKLLFSEYEEELEEKAKRRNFKKSRAQSTS